MPEMMRAIQIMGPDHAEVVQVPVPEPPPGEVLVKVIGVATCPQWDLHLMAGEEMFPGAGISYPYTVGQPGHEMTGVVAAVGEGVTAVQVGERVSAWRDQGHDRPGCYAEYVLMLEDNILPVPPEMDFRRFVSLELAMCMGSSILKLKDFCGIEGRRAAVNGLGPAGFVAAQMLRAEGAESVVGFEVHPGRRKLAEEHAVDRAFDPTSDETMALFPLRGGGQAAIDVAVDCVGYPGPMQFLADRTGLAIAEFAVQRGDYVWTERHDGLEFLKYAGHGRAYAEYALALMVKGAVNLAPTLSAELPFERYAEGVELLRSREAMKILFIP
jgi:threonine dehydrogenase-like Zn-dependent dehydrogenase